MLGRIFSSKHSTQRKALTRVGIVSNGYDVGIRVVANGMNARHLATTDVVNTQELLVCGILLPGFLAIDALYNLFGQRDGCTAGVVELVHVVRLLHLHVVLGKLVHDFRQVTVDGLENGNANGEV